MPGPIGRKPIRSTTPPPSTGDVAPTQGKKVSAKQPFNVDAAGATPESVEQAVGQQFAAIQSRIQEGLSQGLDRKQILESLARHELSEAFGKGVSDKGTSAVADAVSDDPNLSQLFNKLFKLAASE